MSAQTDSLIAPPKLAEFWQNTLDDSRALASGITLVPHESPITTLQFFDVSFSGFSGERIAGWLVLPRETHKPAPLVVEYVGYGGGRGYAHDHLLWASSGYAHFVMDVRGQGSGWRIGSTPDITTAGPSNDSFFTRGITDPQDYYYRRLMTDGVLAVEALAGLDLIDPARMAVSGVSQGGGVAIAVASLSDIPSALLADVPAFGDFRSAVEIAETGPYLAVAEYLAVHREKIATVFETLAHFDTAILGRTASAPALFSLGGRDDLVPPETIRTAFAAYGGPKELAEYSFNGHEGGGSLHDLAKVAWLSRLFLEGNDAA